MNGTFEYSGNTGNPILDCKAIEEFIKALKKPKSKVTGDMIPDISSQITDEEYVAIFNNSRENTSSHPPIHYGHMRAAVESEILTHINTTVMNLPFRYGIPLDRWMRSIHCMIKKMSFHI